MTQAANLFRSLGVTPIAAPSPSSVPRWRQIPVALIGAQVAGIASTINYLLTADAVADLLIAENAEVLVIPSEADDPQIWQKANAVIERVPSLRFVLVVGAEGDPGRKMIGLRCGARAASMTALSFSSTPIATPCARCSIPAGRPAIRSSSA